MALIFSFQRRNYIKKEEMKKLEKLIPEEEVLDTSSPVLLLWHTPGHYQLIKWRPPQEQALPRHGPFSHSLSHPTYVPHTLVDARPPALIDLT